MVEEFDLNIEKYWKTGKSTMLSARSLQMLWMNRS